LEQLELVSQAGLFSAVTSAFVIDAQSNLRPDYNEETTVLLRLLLQNQIQGNPAATNVRILSIEWTGLDLPTVIVLSLLYASLTASLLAVFLAVLGKQWLNRYMSRTGGSAIEKSRDWQAKADGMKLWRFSIVMETLPLMLQAALLLLGCALSRYLWDIEHVIAFVNITMTSIGVFLYIVLIIVASFSYVCPYQIPFSIAVHYLTSFDQDHTRYIPQLVLRFRSLRRSLSSTWRRAKISVPELNGEEAELHAVMVTTGMEVVTALKTLFDNKEAEM
jgi:hypothetical protein